MAQQIVGEELAQFVEKWKGRPGNLIMVLHKTQEVYGYVPHEVTVELGKRLEVPLAKIYGVLTFYHFFRLQKPGKHTLSVCMGTACYMKGGQQLVEGLKTNLGVEEGGTTADGRFSLESLRCVGCCGLAPVVTVGRKIYGNLTPEKLPDVLSGYV